MNKAIQLRVAHPFAQFAEGWGIALSATALLCTALTLPTAYAQSAPCGISSLQTGKPPLYPPIARAAHVSGTVIVMARFDTSGAATAATAISGPEMLKKSATDAIMTWTANTFTGQRECPLIIEFKLVLPADVCDYAAMPEPSFHRIDDQHFLAQTGVVALCDPAATITTTKHHRFLIF